MELLREANVSAPTLLGRRSMRWIHKIEGQWRHLDKSRKLSILFGAFTLLLLGYFSIKSVASVALGQSPARTTNHEYEDFLVKRMEAGEVEVGSVVKEGRLTMLETQGACFHQGILPEEVREGLGMHTVVPQSPVSVLPSIAGLGEAVLNLKAVSLIRQASAGGGLSKPLQYQQVEEPQVFQDADLKVADGEAEVDEDGVVWTRSLLQFKMTSPATLARREAAREAAKEAKEARHAKERSQVMLRERALQKELQKKNLLIRALEGKAAQEQRGVLVSSANNNDGSETMGGTYGTLSEAPTYFYQLVEQRVLNIIRNATAYDSKCQYFSRECAQASSAAMARLFQLNADALKTSSSSAEKQRVTRNLDELRSDSRVLADPLALPSVGEYGSKGTCALVGPGEFDEHGNRFGPHVSRFANVIDAHSTMVFCTSGKKRYCVFSGTNHPNPQKVEVDQKSWKKAVEDGRQIHRLLSEEPELRLKLLAEGYKGTPTATFVNILMLLRSGLCERVDVYGETERPNSWMKVLGNGHLVNQPGESLEDKRLAVALQQELFVYRLVSAVLFGKVCFFQ